MEEAEEWEQALRWYERAIRSFSSLGSLRESEVLCERALEILYRPSLSRLFRNTEIRITTLLSTLQLNLYGYSSSKSALSFQKLMTLVDRNSEVTEECFYAFYGYYSSLHGGSDIRVISWRN